MKQKQKLNHVYFMYISLPGRSAEAKMEWLKPAVCYVPNCWGKNSAHLLWTDLRDLP